MVRYLTEIDHHDHEAIAALDARTGEGIGVARYVRDPQRRDAAEVAVTVIDDWQGKGVGTLLLEVLGARARQEGISSFTALMLATNQEMMEVTRPSGRCGSSIAKSARSRSRCRSRTSGSRLCSRSCSASRHATLSSYPSRVAMIRRRVGCDSLDMPRAMTRRDS